MPGYLTILLIDTTYDVDTYLSLKEMVDSLFRLPREMCYLCTFFSPGCSTGVQWPLVGQQRHPSHSQCRLGGIGFVQKVVEEAKLPSPARSASEVLVVWSENIIEEWACFWLCCSFDGSLQFTECVSQGKGFVGIQKLLAEDQSSSRHQ